ncbi:MAG: hypothetical protein IPN53_26225 [Comamonadaceae bacterium]|nr:hypothetical protein [Comamonadaceae bacterium]
MNEVPILPGNDSARYCLQLFRTVFTHWLVTFVAGGVGDEHAGGAAAQAMRHQVDQSVTASIGN